MLVDYHVHSKFSSDATSGIDEIVVAALKNNMKEIAITDHFEPTMKDEACSFYDYQELKWAVDVAKDRYGKLIDIKLGVEMGHPHRYKEISELLLDINEYDYVLGSAHKGDNDVDVSEHDYLHGNLDLIIKEYFHELLVLSKEDTYDCIGHFDLPKRYALRSGTQIHLNDYYEVIEAILKNVISKGKGIEVNTSLLREFSHDRYMPDIDVLCMYKNLGGEIITVGSDAHKYEDVGAGINKALKLINDIGFKYVCTYENRKPVFNKIENKIHLGRAI